MKTPWYKILGPGLLYAGAAIGVSHLVQSTRAGADFGYGLVWAILLANILKYPFFEFGPRYAASTGKSLLYGYKSIGNWALYLFLVLTFLSMFIIQSAVTVVTAGLASEISGFTIEPWVMSSILLAICTSILLIGKYSILDKTIKLIIFTLSVSTIIALIAAFTGNNEQYQEYMVSFTFSEKSHVLFIIALMGWMPAPLDISVWHSLWTAERNNHEKSKLKSALLDFKIGYWGTLVLALCFVSLGSLTIYGSGLELQNGGGAFAKQLIAIYTNNIGSWAYVIIAIAAFTTMLSTTLTCLDASPRVLAEGTSLVVGSTKDNRKIYFFWIGLLLVGTVIILAFYLTNMKDLVDFATTVAFLSSPIIAILNFLVINGKTMPAENKPGLLLKVVSWLGILYFIGFSIYFVVISN
ncbi:MAG: Nramp family divalent metal transporter [Vicingaceae bacterium]|nr:Nramp family divalent metal transporter [Vicingaceae bacterium]